MYNTYEIDPIFSDYVKPLLLHSVQHYRDCSLIAYGPRGSGKSYCMGTYSQFWSKCNILSSVLGHLSEITNKFTKLNILISCFEVCGNSINDLLFNKPNTTNIQCMKLISYQQAIEILACALKKRKSAYKSYEASKSSLFITFEIGPSNLGKIATKGVFTLIDLVGISVNEEVESNQFTLKMLRKCIERVEYSESKLMQLLLNNFLTDYSIHLMNCISNDSDRDSSIASLKFAREFKRVIEKQLHSKMISEDDTPLCSINDSKDDGIGMQGDADAVNSDMLNAVLNIINSIQIQENSKSLISNKIRSIFKANHNPRFISSDSHSMSKLSIRIRALFNPGIIALCNMNKMGISTILQLHSLCDKIYQACLYKQNVKNNHSFEKIISNNIESSPYRLKPLLAVTQRINKQAVYYFIRYSKTLLKTLGSVERHL